MNKGEVHSAPTRDLLQIKTEYRLKVLRLARTIRNSSILT